MVATGTPSQRTPTTAPNCPRALRGRRGSWLRRLLGGSAEPPVFPCAGARTGSYELVRPLGRGGMGVIWLAAHRRTGRAAAVKLLQTDARIGTDTWKIAAHRLEREAEIMGSLPPGYVASVYEAGHLDDGSPYYAMELIDGVDLHTLVQLLGAQEPGRAAAILSALAEGLAEAHRRGIVHRDIKPANVMLQDGEVKLIDFGVARDDGRDTSLTDEGYMVGTPQYIAPEALATTHPVGNAADVYALGCVGYYLLTGSAPFGGKTPLEVMYAHVHKEPVPLPASVPARLTALLGRCLEKDPGKRPTAIELAVDFARCARA